MKTTRDSLVLDDLEPGCWYEFITPGRRQRIYRGQWEGMEGRLGVLRIPPSYLPLFPDGCTMVKSTRSWAQCIITAIPEPRDVRLPSIAEARERMDAADQQPDGRGIAQWIVAACLAWAAFLLWFFGR